MLSPFPGMDPYLEDPALWSDFHGTFLMAARAELNKLLPEYYVARWDRYVWIDEGDTEPPRPLGKPDVHFSDVLSRDPDESATTVLNAPTTATLPAIDTKGKPFLKIIDVRGHRVVTVVELLSPANKVGHGRDVYVSKRQEYLHSGVNLVEMDFLRNGQRPPVDGKLQPADYYILVSRAVEFPTVGVWPLSVRDALPVIPIPLDPGVDAVQLPLRSCMDRAFDDARFTDDIDYTSPPVPPLNGEDAAWARELLVRQTKKLNDS